MVVSETRNGVESDYVSDTLGSTIGLLGSTVSMTDRWEYWPWGEIVSRNGTNPTPLTFLGIIGYFKDVLDKLFYVRARHLRVDLARWLTVDALWPVQLAYSYSSNAPMIVTDPSGRDDNCDTTLSTQVGEASAENQNCLAAVGVAAAIMFGMCVPICMAAETPPTLALCLACIALALVFIYIGYSICFNKFCMEKYAMYLQFCQCQSKVDCSVCMSAFQLNMKECSHYYHSIGWEYPVYNCKSKKK